MNPTQDELEAERLWQAAGEYFKTACEHFYLDTVLSHEHLPAGFGQEHVAIVHFLFPNLSDNERDALSLFLDFRDMAQYYAKRFPEDRGRYMGDFDSLKRDCEGAVQRMLGKLTAVQMVILEKYFLSEIPCGAK